MAWAGQSGRSQSHVLDSQVAPHRLNSQSERLRLESETERED